MLKFWLKILVGKIEKNVFLRKIGKNFCLKKKTTFGKFLTEIGKLCENNVDWKFVGGKMSDDTYIHIHVYFFPIRLCL